MTKLKNRIISHKYFVLFFTVLTLYSLAFVNRFQLPKIDEVLYTFFLLDYSFGFCTKFFSGAVYNLFVNKPSRESAQIFAAVLLLLIFAGVSLLLEKLVVKLPQKDRTGFLLVCAFYITGPATFSIFSYCFGMIDTWWAFLSILFIVMLNTKIGKYALPLLFILSIMVHEGALLTYVLFFALLILYEAGLSQKKSRQRKTLLIIFFISAFAAIFTFIYFLVFGKDNAVYDIESFINALSERGSDASFNLAYSLYGNGQTNPDIFVKATGISEDYSSAYFTELISAEKYPLIAKFVNAIWNQAQLHWLFYTEKGLLKPVLFRLAALVALLLPLIVLFYKFILKRMKENTGDKLKSFTYFCMLFLLPVASVFTVFMSIDSVKWTSHGFLMLFTLILYMVYKEGKSAALFILQCIRKIKPVFILVYFCLYFITVINPYT